MTLLTAPAVIDTHIHNSDCWKSGSMACVEYAVSQRDVKIHSLLVLIAKSRILIREAKGKIDRVENDLSKALNERRDG